jgi:hypothetical protein
MFSRMNPTLRGFLIVALCCGGALTSTVAAFLNPEYWALKQILK